MVTATDSPRQATWSQSLERGLAILSAFGSDRSTIGVSELSRELGLSRSTTHRYIATLTSLGYLQQDAETKRYRLGPRVLDLGFAAINSMDIREISVPHLQALSDATGFTANMAILDGPDVVYIERCRTSRSRQREIDLNLHVGSRLPAYCTAMGKALLAFVPADRLEEILDQTDLIARGPTRSSNRAALRAEMERVRSLGRGREQRGVGIRAPVDRGADSLEVGGGRRCAQPRRPPVDGLDGRPDRAPGADCQADGRRDIGRDRAPLAGVAKPDV